ncbi:MAG: 2'-5' RNA ligase family protein [Ruminococcaceae bacterium]|nr:2'-5' RNA ligase family protein [Oscillospiraceae bacterium]
MEQASLYSEIAERGTDCIRNSKEQIDPWLKHPEDDTRRGIALLIRIPDEAKEQILRMENALRKAEPDQYYYPASDFHITVLDILAAKPGFPCTHALAESYGGVLAEVLSCFQPFSVSLRGIIPSESALLVKGYSEETLAQIRRALRNGLHSHHLALDERYQTVSSHITFVRFMEQLQNRRELLRILEKNAGRGFGRFEVKSLQLVYHDWYDSRKTVLAEYSLQMLQKQKIME